jgi:hypothetical protein
MATSGSAYLADYGNSRIVIVERKSLEVLYQFGNLGEKPGEFRGSAPPGRRFEGNIYTAEVSPGNRAQRFVYRDIVNDSVERVDGAAAGGACEVRIGAQSLEPGA